TLAAWPKKVHKKRYDELLAEMGPQIRREAAQRQRVVGDRAAGVTVKIIDRLDKEVDKLDTRDLAGAARNMATTSAIGIDKSLILEGEPTQRVEINMPGVVKELRALGVEVDLIEGEVVSEETVRELESGDDTGADSSQKPE
ncbi:MAG: hypothetical protein JST59_16185, partial [Actinobacteria bacterium]|nr:hypothetical protein [Actinomycetota bacterium]